MAYVEVHKKADVDAGAPRSRRGRRERRVSRRRGQCRRAPGPGRRCHDQAPGRFGRQLRRRRRTRSRSCVFAYGTCVTGCTVNINWGALEDAFEADGRNAIHYLNLATGEVLCVPAESTLDPRSGSATYGSSSSQRRSRIQTCGSSWRRRFTVLGRSAASRTRSSCTRTNGLGGGGFAKRASLPQWTPGCSHPGSRRSSLASTATSP